MLIRFTLLIILTNSHQSIQWHFNFPKEQIMNTIGFATLTKHFSQSVQFQLLYLLALTDMRLKQKFFLSNLYTTKLSPILVVLLEKNDLTHSFIQFPPNSNLDESLTLRERDFFNFLVRLIVANLDSPIKKSYWTTLDSYSTSYH